MARMTTAVAFAALALIACAKPEQETTAADNAAPAVAEQTTTIQTSVQPEATASAVHPCSLLTQSDWDAVLGPGVTAEQANEEACKAKKTLGGDFEVVVRLAEDIARDMADDRQYALQPPAAKLSGVGDEAYQSGNGNMVIARKGNYYIRVSGGGVVKNSPKPLAEATKFLAERVVAKL